MRAGSRRSDALLVPWLAGLSLIAAIAVLQALLFPARPQVDELPQSSIQQALRQVGLVVTPLPSRPAKHLPDLTLSRQLGWTLVDGGQLWVVRGAVRRYKELQAATLARGQDALRLKDRRLETPLPGSATGRIDGRPAVQTCLVPQHRGVPLAGVTRSELLRASDPRRALADLRDPGHWSSSLGSLLGPRRFSCVLVTLRSATSRPMPPSQWPKVLAALQRALRPSAR